MRDTRHRRGQRPVDDQVAPVAAFGEQSWRPGTRASAVAAALVSGIAVLHVWWGLGWSWPARDRTRLAQLSAGKDAMPAAVECHAVAAVLAAASTAVLCRPTSRLRRGARACVLAGFATRGMTGVTCSTGALVPWSSSEEFSRLNRRWYGPVCLVIAGLVAADFAHANSGSSA